MTIKVRGNTAAITGLLREALVNARNPAGADCSIIEISPKQTRMNPFHGRLPASLGENAVASLAKSFVVYGQSEPCRGWYLPETDKDGCDVVLICGARRRAAALKAGIQLKVRIQPEPTKAELLKQMYLENSERENPASLPLGTGMELSNLLAELNQGFDALAAERTGKLTLHTHVLECKPAQEVSAQYVPRVREGLHLSPAVFANYLRTNVRTLEKWEQGRAKPNAQAALLIKLVEEFPDTVQRLAAI